MNERLKSLRLEIGLSQSEFANKLLMSQNQLSLIELGKRNLTNRTMHDICREFNVNEEWLRSGNGQMFNDEKSDVNKDVLALVQKISELDPDEQNKIIRMIDIYLEK